MIVIHFRIKLSEFGSVTKLLIPDNLRTGVTKNTRYETRIPRAYREMSDHYGTAIVPARVEHPKEQVVDQMLPEIVQLSVPAPLSPSDTSFPESTHPAVDRTNRANRANHTNPNVRLCVDGVALELEPSVSEDFLRTLIRAVHYA